EAADTTLPGGFNFVLGCDGACDQPGENPVEVTDNAGVIDYVLPISLSRDVTIPLDFESDVFDMDGESITAQLAVATTLNLQYDTADADLSSAFRLTSAPAISLTVSIAAASVTASTRLGVADATVALSGLAVDVSFATQFSDPDGVGGITRDEWMNTLVSDLAAVTRTGSVAGSLTFDTSLIPGSPDTPPISIADPDISTGYSFTLPALGDIADFRLISPSAIIAGIGQAAAGLGGAQAIGDLDLPFITGTVRRIAQASRPILDVVDALGVICGTEGAGNATPAGSIEDLAQDQLVYCQAIVTTGVEAGSVTWNTPGNATAVANTTGADANGTVNLTPTVNAEFQMTAAGDFVVDVAYTATFDDDNDGMVDRTDARTSTLPPMSIQGLATALAALGNFDASVVDLFSYDPTTHALTVDLAMSIDPAEVSLPINVGSQLESKTGVAGLQTTGGSVDADAGPVSIDLTAGVFLLPEAQWGTVEGFGGGCPDPSITDPADCDDALNLFFVEVNPAAPEFAIGDASFTVDAPTLAGQLGYLEVTATVPQFELGRSDINSPVFAVNLTPAGDMTVSGTPVPNAIPLRELLFDLPARTTVSPLNLKFTGDFDITAELNGNAIGTAGVAVSWDPVLVGAPTITPELNFDDLFANFNPVPNLFGTHTGADSTTALVASGANFSASAVGSRLQNLTDGTSCEVASVDSATELTCADPLAGAAGSEWNNGDFYRLEVGSPLAMLEVILDNLDSIVDAIDNVSGAGLGAALDTELPIVG
ncbi:MAG: hypothetical protein OEO77_15780, partial [Acidimicrobiia bacterium]|nr:hypothetical protein [Acidimicrobiia bacterium]